MLDMGFEPDIRHIVHKCNMPPAAERQTTLFSATFPKEIRRLASDFTRAYCFLQVGKIGSTTENITQTVKFVEAGDKMRELEKDIELYAEQGTTIVFTETKRACERVGTFLWDKGKWATSIHGDKEQWQREAALKEFKAGKMKILVATDVAARGLDVDGIAHVINYELPMSFDSYVHRIGRTGRAGNTGHATAYFNDKNNNLARELVTFLGDAKQTVPDFLRGVKFSNSKTRNKARWDARQRGGGGGGGRGGRGGRGGGGGRGRGGGGRRGGGRGGGGGRNPAFAY
jgi:ATP-dependent RNA helicase DDX3X